MTQGPGYRGALTHVRTQGPGYRGASTHVHRDQGIEELQSMYGHRYKVQVIEELQPMYGHKDQVIEELQPIVGYIETIREIFLWNCLTLYARKRGPV